MISTSYYEYIDLESIDPDLICTFCHQPFIDPFVTQCGYTYCHQCIQEDIKKSSCCPSQSCQQLLSTSHLTPIPPRLLISILNKLKVRCMLCGNETLDRGNFDQHINENCCEYRLDCPKKDIGCSWFGQRNKLKDHMETCLFVKLQPALDKLYSVIENNQRQTEKLKEQLEQQMIHFEEEKKQQQYEIEELSICLEKQKICFEEQIKQLHVTTQEQETELEKQKFEIDELRNLLEKQRIHFEEKIKILHVTTQKQETELKQQNVETDELRNLFQNQRSEFEEKLQKQKIEYQNLIEECKIQLKNIDSQNQNQANDILSAHNQVTTFEGVINSLKNTIRSLFVPDIPKNASWSQKGTTAAGGNGQGSATNQLYFPLGLFVDDDQTVTIADSGNHRIMQWKKNDTNGHVIAGGKGQGDRLDQLNYPTDVLIDKETDSLIIADRDNSRVIRWPRRMGTIQGEIIIDNIKCFGLAVDDQRYLYVSDNDKHEFRRYKLGDKNGSVVAGGNGIGEKLNQLNSPRYLFVDQQQNVYVTEENNHRVMKWTKGANEGIVVAGGKGAGSALTQLHWPDGLFVDNLGTLYVTDGGNHRVLRWLQGETQGTVIVGGNGEGENENQLSNPAGLSLDRCGNLYVVDQNNHRVQCFSIE